MFSALGQGETLYAPPIQGASLQGRMQNRKKEQITHPYLNEKVSIGLLPYIQAMLLARFIRKDIDDYPVFLIK